MSRQYSDDVVMGPLAGTKPGRRRSESSFGGYGGHGGVPAELFRLQGLAGNKAVAALLTDPSAGVVQRSPGGCTGPGTCGCSSCGPEDPGAPQHQVTDAEPAPDSGATR